MTLKSHSFLPHTSPPTTQNHAPRRMEGRRLDAATTVGVRLHTLLLQRLQQHALVGCVLVNHDQGLTCVCQRQHAGQELVVNLAQELQVGSEVWLDMDVLPPHLQLC